MGSMLIGVLGSSIKMLVLSFISERVILTAVHGILENMAKKSTNTIDDRVLVLVKEALKAKGMEV